MRSLRTVIVALAVALAAASLCAQLAETQRAAERGNRFAFTESLAALKAAMASGTLPASERAAAAAAIPVYDDLARVWTYQYESPAGAFFDSSTGLDERIRRYPGYASFIASRTLKSGNSVVYPTRETLEFLVRQARTRIAGDAGARAEDVPPVATLPKARATSHAQEARMQDTKKSEAATRAPGKPPAVAAPVQAPPPAAVPAPVTPLPPAATAPPLAVAATTATSQPAAPPMQAATASDATAVSTAVTPASTPVAPTAAPVSVAPAVRPARSVAPATGPKRDERRGLAIPVLLIASGLVLLAVVTRALR